MAAVAIIESLPIEIQNKVSCYLDHPTSKMIKDNFDIMKDGTRIFSGLRWVNVPQDIKDRLSPNEIIYRRHCV